MNIPEITTLPNGLKVMTIHSDHTATATVAVFVNVGADMELPEENGLSHFLEHMAFKGTKTRSAVDISRAGEIYGAEMNAYTSRAVTCYFVTSMAEHAPKWVELLSDIIQNSVFDPAEIAIEQDVVVQEIHGSADRLPSCAYNNLFAAAYPNQSFGHTILGSIENVRSFDQEKIKQYVAKHYFAENMMVVATGDIDHAAFVAEVEKNFTSLPNGEAPDTGLGSFNSETTIVDAAMDKFDQAVVHLAFEAPEFRFDCKRAAVAEVLADALGGGMSSPLFQELREKRGLCYATRAGYLAVGGSSIFDILIATTPEHVESFKDAALGELNKFAIGDFSDDELTRAVNTQRFAIARIRERPFRIAETTVEQYFATGRVPDIAGFSEMIAGVTREDIQSYAKELMESPYVLVKTGNIA